MKETPHKDSKESKKQHKALSEIDTVQTPENINIGGQDVFPSQPFAHKNTSSELPPMANAQSLSSANDDATVSRNRIIFWILVCIGLAVLAIGGMLLAKSFNTVPESDEMVSLLQTFVE